MKSYILFILLFFTSQAFAIFCPTNFSSINFGDSIDEVKRVCGDPNSFNQYTTTTTSNQIWTYYIKAPGISQRMTKMVILFRDNLIVNIQIIDDTAANIQLCESVQTGNRVFTNSVCKTPLNSQNVASTNICGALIQVGNTRDIVTRTCGAPALKKDVGQANPPVNVTEFIYNGPPPVTLIFENGQLKDRKFK
jgi:hypothetical protein